MAKLYEFKSDLTDWGSVGDEVAAGDDTLANPVIWTCKNRCDLLTEFKADKKVSGLTVLIEIGTPQDTPQTWIVSAKIRANKMGAALLPDLFPRRPYKHRGIQTQRYTDRQQAEKDAIRFMENIDRLSMLKQFINGIAQRYDDSTPEQPSKLFKYLEGGIGVEDTTQ